MQPRGMHRRLNSLPYADKLVFPNDPMFISSANVSHLVSNAGSPLAMRWRRQPSANLVMNGHRRLAASAGLRQHAGLEAIQQHKETQSPHGKPTPPTFAAKPGLHVDNFHPASNNMRTLYSDWAYHLGPGTSASSCAVVSGDNLRAALTIHNAAGGSKPRFGAICYLRRDQPRAVWCIAR
ncbi:hypothetical protein CI238_11143 [Colletotrichum incanum]|uniref:Uncharacterized protein n=1 Tax=Colletotrichum incanum TaxID=1573173 RepID=A0A167DSR8_COLIC|nr:hypothetical protein CI238_11143 [Colletotrichum incanum]